MFAFKDHKVSFNIYTGIMFVLTAWLSNVTCFCRTLMIFTGALFLARVGMERIKSWRTLSRRKTPPGPRGFPVVGFLPMMKGDVHLQFTSFAQKYGSVYQLYLGSKRVVVVSDPVLVRDAFKQPVFSGRPDTELTKILQGYGVINADGALWREQRSFLHSTLRDFGAKNPGCPFSSLEKTVKTQIAEFLDTLRETNCKGLHIRVPLARAISNIVGSMLMSVTFGAEDEEFGRLLELIDEGFRLLTLAVPVNFVPALRVVPHLNHNYNKIRRNKEETNAYFERVANWHKRTLDPENVRDIVDAFYVQQMKSKALDKKTYFSEKQLHQLMGDIFSAALETVTSLIEWGTLYLVRFPEVQVKLQEEIDRVIGQDREPEWKDLPNMPYAEATILEMMRKANVIALGNTHATLGDAELGGYFIPKGSHVIPNFWAIHMDPELWDEPEVFRPERFLVNGQVVKPPYFMPFSVGRRMCVGDTLARMEVFLFVTSILQKFTFRVPDGEKEPELHGDLSLSLRPFPFKVSAIPRHAHTS